MEKKKGAKAKNLARFVASVMSARGEMRHGKACKK